MRRLSIRLETLAARSVIALTVRRSLLAFSLCGDFIEAPLEPATGKERQQADAYVKQFDIKAASLNTHLINLSGGNQQKVYLSKWMDTAPEILILDEPTRGIDINTKKEIYHFIQKLTEQGVSVIVISSEMDEIIGLCNRVIVMRNGSKSGELEGSDINEEEIMYYASGLKGNSHEIN